MKYIYLYREKERERERERKRERDCEVKREVYTTQSDSVKHRNKKLKGSYWISSNIAIAVAIVVALLRS